MRQCLSGRPATRCGSAWPTCAADLPRLLAALDGRAGPDGGGAVTIDTEGAFAVQSDMNPAEVCPARYHDPNIAYVLLTVGGAGALDRAMAPRRRARRG